MTTPMPADEHQPAMQANRYAHGIALTCPHCDVRAIIRTSRKVVETYREAWAICPGCGFKGKAHVSWDCEASPSLMPNPKVSLPKLDYREAVEQFTAEELARRPQMDMFVNTG
ncbi:ogr/Delta-like zinc finger family protein [Denitromonas sp.]|uniref:ogr/Delta-like zinc finger family protein n=1 Tax=Denitromonas sp. TaxID=2734609 RepID=UPI003A8B2CA7